MEPGPKCVGCGWCCSTRMCRIGSMKYGSYTTPCPALSREKDRYVCRLYLEDPDRYAEVLEIGGGCCFPSNPRRVHILHECSTGNSDVG